MGTTMTPITLIMFGRDCFLWLLVMALAACQGSSTNSIHMHRIHCWIAAVVGGNLALLSAERKILRSPANMSSRTKKSDMHHILGDGVDKSTMSVQF